MLAHRFSCFQRVINRPALLAMRQVMIVHQQRVYVSVPALRAGKMLFDFTALLIIRDGGSH